MTGSIANTASDDFEVELRLEAKRPRRSVSPILQALMCRYETPPTVPALICKWLA